jgi:hypothetical protein
MTYSIFDGSGNLIDAFTDRVGALDRLAGITRADPAAANEFFLIAQHATGATVGGAVFATSVTVRA